MYSNSNYIIVSGKTNAEVHASIQKNQPLRQRNPHVTLSADSINLIQKTQHVIPRLRATVRQIQNHKWLQNSEVSRRATTKHDSRWQADIFEIKKLKVSTKLARCQFPFPFKCGTFFLSVRKRNGFKYIQLTFKR